MQTFIVNLNSCELKFLSLSVFVFLSHAFKCRLVSRLPLSSFDWLPISCLQAAAKNTNNNNNR